MHGHIETTLTHAIRLAARGVHVSPGFGFNKGLCGCKNPYCWRPGKHPFVQEEPSLSSVDEEEITSMWTAKNLNLVVHTGLKSSLLVIDVDHRDGGLDRYQAQMSCLPLFTDTFSVRSGSGGLHFYFECDEDIPSCRDGVGQGIDICSNPTPGIITSYVIGPGSSHVSGKTYEILNDLPFLTINQKQIDELRSLVN